MLHAKLQTVHLKDKQIDSGLWYLVFLFPRVYYSPKLQISVICWFTQIFMHKKFYKTKGKELHMVRHYLPIYYDMFLSLSTYRVLKKNDIIN